MDKKLQQANELLEIQRKSANNDNYSLGLYNGMEMITSLFEERNPEYIKLDNKKEILTPIEKQIYNILNERRGKLVEYNEITEKVFNYTNDSAIRTLQVQISRMRKKGIITESKRGIGYILID